MNDTVATNQTILVVGGGISGMTAALEAAECGKDVVLVEKRAALGGRVSQLYKYFPKMCRPSCGQEINQRRIQANRRLRVITLAEITKLRGRAGGYTATIHITPRYVNANCTACGDCARAVSAEIDSPHDYAMRKIKAAYLPHNLAWPQRYVIDASIVGTEQGEAARAACRYDAVDLDMREENIELQCGAVIFATGWRPYDAAKIQPYGYARYANVVTSVEFERMMDPHGPSGGKLLRPSDGKEAKDIAFVQCAGSRDRNHLAHCSRVCCMASLKQSAYVGECYGDDARSTIYYIDIRGIDRFEDFERKVREDERVRFVKSKVAHIEQAADGSPVLHGVDTHGGRRYANSHDLAVLAVGMQPSIDATAILGHGANGAGMPGVDAAGFIELERNDGGGGGADAGVFAAGCAADTLDVNRSVQGATAAALRAIQVVNRIARAG
ncbi:MAG: FAD-dependent oxidoreductase [Gammaproteobacteria bacterium]